ncbi:MAG: CAP domain-containing protein [Bacteroidia bacterium]|nr:CAP domain-containing protein [Bacteroidia bacterium]
MRFLVLSMVLAITAGFARADEKTFNRLQKKFNKDSAKGLEYAKRLTKKKPREADAYYYLAYTDWNKFRKTDKLLKQYASLNRASSNTYKLARYGGRSRYLKPYIDTMKSTLATYLAMYRDTFRLREDLDRSERLAYQYKRLTGKALPTLNEIEEQKKKQQKLKQLALQTTRMVGGKYYGLPSGEEEIVAFNSDAEKEVIRILNAARKKRGLKELRWDESLARSARYHANDMASQNYFSHSTCDSIDGEIVTIVGAFKRIRRFYNGKGFANGENIAAGSSKASGTYHQWFTSKGHHDIMFNPSSSQVGVGLAYNPKSFYKYYWVLCTAKG